MKESFDSLSKEEALVALKELFIKELPMEILYFRSRVSMLPDLWCLWASPTRGIMLTNSRPQVYEYLIDRNNDPEIFLDFVQFMTDAVHAHDL